jgi:hypothetical protein
MRLIGESPLSEFWDSHDLTDFEDELEEAAEPVFVRSTAITCLRRVCGVRPI